MNGSITQSGAAKGVELQSVNGDDRRHEGERPRQGRGGQRRRRRIHDASGELEASTVNGKLLVTGGSCERAELESVAGGVRFEAALSAARDRSRSSR